MKYLLSALFFLFSSLAICSDDEFTGEDLEELEHGLKVASQEELDKMALAANASMASTFSMIFSANRKMSAEEASIRGVCAAELFKVEPTREAIIEHYKKALDSEPNETLETLANHRKEFFECVREHQL